MPWQWASSVCLAALLLVVWYAGDTSWQTPQSFLGNHFPVRSAVVATDVLNLRDQPSRSATVLSTATEGQTVQITGDAVGDFVPVQFAAESGWMASAYLEPNALDTPLANDGVTEVMAAEFTPEDSKPTALDGSVQESGYPSSKGTIDVALSDAGASNDSVISNDEPEVAQEIATSSGERWIQIDRSEATVTLHEGSLEVAIFSGRMGRDPASDGFYSTAVGSYRVYSLNKGLAPTPFAEDTWLTDWVGFDPERKNGIHSPVRERDGTVRDWQNPTTLGCVRLDEDAAVTVFDFAELGMRVEVVE